MPFISKRPTLRLTEEEGAWLQQLSQSRSEAAGRVQRAEILLRYHSGETVSSIAATLRTNRPRVERCIAKALELGVRGALQDLPGRGRRPALSAEARTWVVALACQRPKELGYAQELWTTRLLAKHVRKHCRATGHPSLQHLARGTVSKILRAQPLQPHKIGYYLERREDEFEAKMKQVLHVYRQVELWRQAGAPAELTAVLSYDEKPGIQALENTAPDLAPVPGAWLGIRIAVVVLLWDGYRPTSLARLFGLTRMSLTRWVHWLNGEGVQGLLEKPRPGRPTQLTARVRQQLSEHLRQSPEQYGLPRTVWDGPTLAVHLRRRFGIQLKARQAQHWLHRLGYRLKRARYTYLQARAADVQSFSAG